METHDSAQFRFVRGQLQRSTKPQQLRGLNNNHNPEMKEIFRSPATSASRGAGPFPRFLRGFVGQGDGARNGRSDTGTQDRSHYFDTLEKRRTFRRRTTESASSLSISQNPGDLPGFHASVVANRFLRCSAIHPATRILNRADLSVNVKAVNHSYYRIAPLRWPAPSIVGRLRPSRVARD